MSETTIVGLDTASNRWHAVGTGGLHRHMRIDKTPNADERRWFLYESAREFFQSLPDGAHVFCEEPLSLQNGKTTRLLGLAAGAIWAAQYDCDLWWHWVDVAHWKKEVVGKGNAKKEDIKAWCLDNPAFHHQGIPVSVLMTEEDYYDAYCLKVYGARAIGGGDAVAVQ